MTNDKDKDKEKKLRKKTIKIRLDDDIYNQLQDLKQLGNFDTWQDVLKHLQHNQKGFKKVLVDETGDSLKLINQLSKIGINLNQIAKIGNESKQFTEIEVKNLRAFYSKVTKIKNYFCKNVVPDFKSGGRK